MVQNPLENTGERFLPTESDTIEIHANLDRYMFALSYIKNKRVLELGCGSGLGTYLYSLVAQSIMAIDYNEQAIEHAKLYPFDQDKVQFQQMDLEKETPTLKYDVCVALEVLEHIENPAKVLEELNCDYLVFSLPSPSLEISKWHKYPIRAGKEGLEDVKKLINKNYRIDHIQIQDTVGNKKFNGCYWALGYAKRRKSWL